MYRSFLNIRKVISQIGKIQSNSNFPSTYLKSRTILTSPVIKSEPEMIEVNFLKGDGSKIKVKGKIGDNFLDVVINNNVDLDGFGACEGTLSCSTCHLIFSPKDFANIDQKITEEELDMLDLAYGLTDTSRLGCQVCLSKKLEGVVVTVPVGVNDVRSP